MLAIPVSKDISRLFRQIEVNVNRESSDHHKSNDTPFKLKLGGGS